MIPPVDITSVKSPALTEASPLLPNTSPATAVAATAPQVVTGTLTQSAVGQLFQAQVLARLEDDTYLVNVADNAMRMALPPGTNVGASMKMTLLSTDPRPAFLLEQSSDTNSPLLSNAGKLINTVLQSAQQSGALPTIVGKVPLLAEPTPDPPHIADAMQDGIEFSGVFYESHVGQWVSGERPFVDLLREPQLQMQAAPTQPRTGQLATDASTPKTQVSTAANVLQKPVADDSALAKLIESARSAQDLPSKLSQALSTLQNSRTLPQEADTVVHNQTLTQETAQTINVQLNTLEQHRVTWQGDLWPGQKFEWEISDESSRSGQHGSAADDQGSWTSVVKFELPKLGKISASIHLVAGHVQVMVNAATPDSAAALKAHSGELADALESAGTPLDALVIKQNEKT
jgi:hypothetical protein